MTSGGTARSLDPLVEAQELTRWAWPERVVITDRAVFAYLSDVFVVPAYRGQGVGKALMRAILEHQDLQGLTVFLLRTRDAHGLYEPFGFERVSRPEELMVRLGPGAYG